MSQNHLSERLADYAWAIAANDRSTLEVFRKVIEAGGGSWEEDDYQVTLTGPSGIRGGFYPGHLDPINACILVNLMLFGEQWESVPAAVKALYVVNKRWDEHAKAAKERRRAQQKAGNQSADSLQLRIDF
jgi:hypothetical protein